MDVREAIYGRRAVREFTTEPVEEAALRRLVDAAIQAPSAVNQQPWLFTIVRDKELLARVIAAERWRNLPHADGRQGADLRTFLHEQLFMPWAAPEFASALWALAYLTLIVGMMSAGRGFASCSRASRTSR